MQTYRLIWGVVLMVAVITVGVGGWESLVFAQKAFVEVTGQTTSDAPGDDGDLQAGVPFPTPRFRDMRDGTVRDNLTNLIWLKDANCVPGAGPDLAWQDALNAANTLASGRCGLTDSSRPGDWRLPNIKELLSLIDYGQKEPALPAGHPFINVQATYDPPSFSYYWSSTATPYFPPIGWALLLQFGELRQVNRTIASPYIVWPVKGGD
jgi:hypothetical protein